MTKPDHSYDPSTFSLGVTDGIVGRDATQGEGEVMTYKCNTCPQFTQEPVTHEEEFHPEAVQSRDLSLLNPKGIVTRVIAPILIIGTSLLNGCVTKDNKPLIQVYNQKFQGWFDGNPTMVVFDEQRIEDRFNRNGTPREPRFILQHDNDPRKGLKIGQRYDFVANDTTDYKGLIKSITPSK